MKRVLICICLGSCSLFAAGQSKSFRLDYWQEGGSRAISQPWFQIRENKLINITSQSTTTGPWKRKIVTDTIVLSQESLKALTGFLKAVKDSSVIKRNLTDTKEITHCLTLMDENHRIDFRLNNSLDQLAEYIVNIINPYLPEPSRVKLTVDCQSRESIVKTKSSKK